MVLAILWSQVLNLCEKLDNDQVDHALFFRIFKWDKKEPS